MIMNNTESINEKIIQNMIEITDFDAPELDVYARLTEAQLLNKDHPEDGLFIAESPKVISRALDGGYEPVSVLVEKKQVLEDAETIAVLGKCGNVPVYTAEFEVLTKLTGFKLTRGMLCAMKRRRLPGLQEICNGCDRIAVLENVMNPTNVGAIFRSAAALHMDAVILTGGCSNPLYRRASRVSMGTVFQIPWTFVDNSVIWPEEGMKILRELGFKTAAMALKEDSANGSVCTNYGNRRNLEGLPHECQHVMDHRTCGCNHCSHRRIFILCSYAEVQTDPESGRQTESC